ncbi:MAG: hypothetical protein RMK18_05560 [Armatimonadota bacterium]|nr:hypothetical protein [Armatimonadota bacterium]MCX7777795.1 hypothetical protein [Armatimonadota bacterium]MDW8025318.1 hypothetical protein [Armatimonadota bacterium]
MRALVSCRLSLIVLICGACWVGCSVSMCETGSSKIAYVDVERLMLSHPMSGELIRLMSVPKWLVMDMRATSEQLPRDETHERIGEDVTREFKIPLGKIPEPNEPTIQTARADLSLLKRSAELLAKVVEQMQGETREQIELLTGIKRAELREEYIMRTQLLLERQSPKRTRIRVRLLNPSLSEKERSALIAEEERLNAELEQQLIKLRQQLDEQLRSWRLSLEREADEQLCRLKGNINEMLNESIRVLQHEPEKPRWLNLRELWDAFSPRDIEPIAMVMPQKRLANNELEMQAQRNRLLENATGLTRHEWMNNWQTALRRCVIEFARMYALQHGFKMLVTERRKDATDITDQVIASLQQAITQRR